MAKTKKGVEPEVYLFNEIQTFPEIVNKEGVDCAGRGVEKGNRTGGVLRVVHK